MQHSRWEQVEALYHAALECPLEGRASFLLDRCNGDEELLSEVRSLLAYDEVPGFLAGSPLYSSPAAPQRLSTIGPYQIVSEIGSGGMGQVYKARDSRLNRDVAIKFLNHSQVAGREALERFRREARAASALNHPGICTIYDVGEQDGQPYLVMELLTGQPLNEYISVQVLSVRELLDVAIQAAAALEAAHAKGILHRDIKPANLLLTPDGRLKILDFGLAKLAGDSGTDERENGSGVEVEDHPQALTRVGTTLGTIAYMSPEQARGEFVDARTDLFSLGVTLFQLATGTAPFLKATTDETLRAILHEQPQSVRALNPSMPAALDRIIGRCLAKDRTGRYSTAAELHEDLERLRTRMTRSRAPVIAAVITAAALAAVITGLYSGWFRSPAPELPTFRQRQLTANPVSDPVFNAAISADGSMLAYSDLQGLHLRDMTSGDVRRVALDEHWCFR